MTQTSLFERGADPTDYDVAVAERAFVDWYRATHPKSRATQMVGWSDARPAGGRLGRNRRTGRPSADNLRCLLCDYATARKRTPELSRAWRANHVRGHAAAILGAEAIAYWLRGVLDGDWHEWRALRAARYEVRHEEAGAFLFFRDLAARKRT